MGKPIKFPAGKNKMPNYEKRGKSYFKDKRHSLHLYKKHVNELKELCDDPENYISAVIYQNALLNAKKRAEKRGREINHLQRIYQAQMRDFENFNKALEEAEKLEGKERADFLKPKIRKFYERWEKRKADYERLKDDCAAVSPSAAAAAGVLGSAACLVVGAILGAHLFSTHETKTVTETVYKEKPAEKVYEIGEDGTIYEDGSPMSHEDILEKLDKTDLFTDKQIEWSKALIEQKLNEKDVSLKFNPDGSLDVYLEGETEKGKNVVENTVDAKDVHEGIMPKLAGEDVPYVLQPKIKDGASEAVYPIHKSMRPAVKQNASIEEEHFNAIKVGFEPDGKMWAKFGYYNETTGKFQAKGELTEEQAMNALYTLADNNPDVDKAVQDTMRVLKDNAFGKLAQDYENLDGSVKDFLDKYGFESLEDASKLIDDLNGLLSRTKQKNITTLGEMIDFLKETNATWNEVLGKYGVTNKTALYDLLDDWWALVNETNKFVADYGRLNLTEVRNYIAELEENKTRLEDIFAKYNVSDELELEEMISNLEENKTRLEEIFAKYNVSDKEGLYGYVQSLKDEIDRLERDINTYKAKIEILGAPLTAENITIDANSTAAWDLIMKQADRAGLDVYRLDLRDESQLAAARGVFGDAVVERWLADNASVVEIVDAIDSGDDAAVVGVKDSKHLQYVEAVNKDTWEAGKQALEEYKIDEY